MPVFCLNYPNKTHKTKNNNNDDNNNNDNNNNDNNNNNKTNNNKVHALVTKQKKKIWKMSTGHSNMSFRKKLVKPQSLGFLTFFK